MFTPRSHARRIVSLRALIVIPADVLTIIPCLILDLSPSGAKIKFGINVDLPPRLYLLEDEAETLYDCEIRWQREEVAGVVFLDICPRLTRRAIMARFADAVILEPLAEKPIPSAAPGVSSGVEDAAAAISPTGTAGTSC